MQREIEGRIKEKSIEVEGDQSGYGEGRVLEDR